MKYVIHLLIIAFSTIAISSCDSGQLGPREFFSESNRLISSAAVTLEGVKDGKTAHQASQKLTALSEEIDDVVLRVKPFNQMSATEADIIIKGFGQGRTSLAQLGQAANNIKRNRDHWIVLEVSVNKFAKSMEKSVVVMRSYIEALPTQ